MADKIGELKSKIANHLREYSQIVGDENLMGKFSINHSAEEHYRMVLNFVFSDRWELVNMNEIKPNYAGVDLGDVTKKVGIQVTSDSSPTKIQKTIKAFIKHNLDDFEELFVFIIKGKKVYGRADFSKTTQDKFEFDKDTHIIDNEYST